MPRATIDLRRLGRGDLVAGGATLIVLIALFLPWYAYARSSTPGHVSSSAGSSIPAVAQQLCSAQPALCSSSTAVSSFTLSATASGAGGWRFLILVVSILIVLYLLVRTVLSVAPRLPLPHWQLLTAASGVNAALVLISFLVKPFSSLDLFGISVSWSYGAFLGLAAAAVAVIGSAMRRNEPEALLTTGPGAPSHPRPAGLAAPAMRPPSSAPQTIRRSEERHCPSCGQLVTSGHQFCTRCGSRL